MSAPNISRIEASPHQNMTLETLVKIDRALGREVEIALPARRNADARGGRLRMAKAQQTSLRLGVGSMRDRPQRSRRQPSDQSPRLTGGTIASLALISSKPEGRQRSQNRDRSKPVSRRGSRRGSLFRVHASISWAFQAAKLSRAICRLPAVGPRKLWPKSGTWLSWTPALITESSRVLPEMRS